MLFLAILFSIFYHGWLLFLILCALAPLCPCRIMMDHAGSAKGLLGVLLTQVVDVRFRVLQFDLDGFGSMWMHVEIFSKFNILN